MTDLRKITTPIDEAGAIELFRPLAQAIDRAAASKTVDGVIDLVSVCSGAMRLHDGPLELDGLHLAAGDPTLIVRGDLTVRGVIEQSFRAGFLIVFGHLRAAHLVTTAQIFVSGDLTVEHTLFGNCTNYATIVLGHTQAETVVSAKEHYFCCYGGRTASRVVDCYGDTPNLDDRTDGQEVLVDEVDGGHHAVAVASLLRAGRAILR